MRFRPCQALEIIQSPLQYEQLPRLVLGKKPLHLTVSCGSGVALVSSVVHTWVPRVAAVRSQLDCCHLKGHSFIQLLGL